MNDPVVLILFLATWGGIALLFRRLADDFRKASVRQSEKPAQIDEELLRITTEVQETIEGLSDAMGKRSEQLRTLLAEADIKLEALQTAAPSGAAEVRASAVSEDPATLLGGPGGVPPVAPKARNNIELGGPGERSVPRPPEARHESPTPSTNRAPISEVHRLASEGHDPATIARLTNRGREEILLLLGTRH